MARDAVKPTRHGGLYEWLAQREQRAVAHGGTLFNTETGTSYDGTPERLATFRAGEPVHLPVGALPEHARAGMDTRWMHRVTVTPEGAITSYADDGSAWLAENGL